MRAGQLNRRVVIKKLSGDPPGAVTVTTVWGGFSVAATGSVPVSGGLRSPAAIQCRMRYPDLLAGWYLVDGLQLFHVNHVRNPDNKGRDWLASCTELVGDPAVYTPAGGDPVDTRCFVIHDAPFIGEHSQAVVYRARLELPLIEVGRAKKGDRVTTRGVDYEVLGLVAGGDDGVVRLLWGTPT